MKLYNLLALAVLLILSSCSQKDEPLNPNNSTSSTIGSGEKVSLSIDLSGEARMVFDRESSLDEENSPRSFNYSIEDNDKGANIAPITAEKLYSIAVISNKAGTTTHTFFLEWTKSKIANRYEAKEIGKTDIDGQPIDRLDPNDEWFISGVLTPDKSKIDLKTRKIHFKPNEDIGPVNHSATPDAKRSLGKDQVSNDIPLYFEWTKLSVPADKDGKDAVSTEKSHQDLGTDIIKIRPMGTLMRIKLKNDNSYPVRVKSLRVFSSVLATSEGDIDLSGYNHTHKSEQIKYIPKNITQDDLYQLSNLDLQANEAYAQDFIIWGVPVKAEEQAGAGDKIFFNGREFSQVILDVKRLNGDQEMPKPSMNALYVWGSDHNNPKQATRLRITASIYRPTNILEYYSDGYWDGTKNENPFTIDTTKYIYKGSKELFDMQDSEYPDGYRAMKYNDGSLLFPRWAGKLGLFTKGQNSDIKRGSYNLRLPGETADSSPIDSVQYINNVLYALRFDDGKGPNKRKHLSAWRYDYNRATIESVYLGPTFKGFFRDILKDEFWENHKEDIVKRTYGPAKTLYFNMENNKPVTEWYYLRYPEKSGILLYSNFLLSAVSEIRRPNGQPQEISQAFGLNIDVLVRGGWYFGSFVSTNNGNAIDIPAERRNGDPAIPQGVKSKITAARKMPVILIEKAADY